MKIIYNNVVDSRRYVASVLGERVRIGRRPDNDIVLNSPYVPEEALVLYKRREGWELVACGLETLQVGEEEVRGGDRLLITADQQIKIFPFVLTLDMPDETAPSDEMKQRALDEEAAAWIGKIHVELLKKMDVRTHDEMQAVSEEYLLSLERNIEEIARIHGVQSRRTAALARHIAGHSVRSEFLARIVEQSDQRVQTPWESDHHWSRLLTAVPNLEDELNRLIDQLSERLGLARIADLGERIDSVERGFWNQWNQIAADLFEKTSLYLALRYLKKQIKDIVFGYGPLEDLLRTPTITEIMVVDRNHIYIERSGRLEFSGRRFISDDITLAIIERIVSKVNRRIDKSQPLVDARLTDGSRVNAIIPPLAVSGPCLTIRKFPLRRLLIDDLVQKGTLTRTVTEFLRAAVLHRANVLISGGTGTGKTTLLNCLSDFIPDKERIVTIEDTAELQLKKEHVVRLESKPPNIEGAGAYAIRDLVRNSLRMRPDRIVVGECRGPEALDMLQAMNTGHDGSMTTIHANTSADVILRLEVLVQMAADLPVTSIHRQIASAIDLIVQLTRMRDGSRRVTQVTEVVDVDPQEHSIRTRDIFLLEEVEGRSELRPTGRLPTFMAELIESGQIRLQDFYL